MIIRPVINQIRPEYSEKESDIEEWLVGTQENRVLTDSQSLCFTICWIRHVSMNLQTVKAIRGHIIKDTFNFQAI